jgi:YHS domain-containing protein
MNPLNRIVRAVVWGLVTGGLLSLVRQASEDPQSIVGPTGKSLNSVRLHRDPVCGIYVSPEISIKLEKSGQITHFCSVGCCAQFTRSAAQAAGA